MCVEMLTIGDILRQPDYRPRLIREPGVWCNPIIEVTGVTSVGKDFLLSMTRYADNVISFGTMLSEITGLPRDEFRKTITSLTQVTDLQMQAADLILGRAPVILNTHVVTKQNGVYVINYDLEKKLKPAYYVAFVADPIQITNWRIERERLTTRKSDVETVDQIMFHQAMILSTLHNLSRVLGTGYAVIGNIPENTQQNIDFLNMLSQTVIH